MEKDYVIVVNKNDKEIGIMEKMEAHRQGQLHRAFSIFIFNAKKEMLLQKRAIKKYHSGGLWTNTCCSHPRPGEDMDVAANRRLMEEMNFSCHLKKTFSFIYKKEVDNYLIEHELDHVYIGTFNGEPSPNKLEVLEWKFAEIDWIKKDIKLHPENYTEWFKISLGKVIAYFKKINPSLNLHP